MIKPATKTMFWPCYICFGWFVKSLWPRLFHINLDHVKSPPPLALCRWLKITTCCCFNQCCWKNLTSPISFWGCVQIPGPVGGTHLLLVKSMATVVLLLNLKLIGSSKNGALSKFAIYFWVMPHVQYFQTHPKFHKKNVDVILRYFKYPIFMNDPRFTIPSTCCTGVSHTLW